MANEAYLFRIVGCRCRKWRLREGGGKESQLFIIKCFRGWALVFAGEAGFPGLRRLNNRQQTTENSRHIGAEMLLFKILALIFSKFSETVTAILLTKIDESSKLRDACHVEMGIRSSPRNVVFQSARPPDKPTGRRDKSSNCYFSKIFAPLEIFSNSNSSQQNRRIVEITEMSATLRWSYGRGPWIFTFQSARPLDYGTTFVYCILIT